MARGWRAVLLAVGVLMTAPAMGAEGLPEIDKLWDWGSAKVSEARFREVLPKARAGGDAGYLVELLTQLGRSLGRQNRFDEAHRVLDEAEALLQPGLDRARVRLLLERGRAFNSGKQVEKSRPLFLQAWELAGRCGEEALALDAAHMLGIVEPPEKALEWSHRAIALAEKSEKKEVRGWLGPLYNNTGWTYYERGDYPRALELLRKAQAFYEERGTAAQVRIARYSVGKALRALGKTEEALAIQQAVKRELTAAKEEDGHIDEELGECLLALKREAEAKPHFKKAYELLSKDQWLSENEPKRLERLKKLAQ